MLDLSALPYVREMYTICIHSGTSLLRSSCSVQSQIPPGGERTWFRWRITPKRVLRRQNSGCNGSCHHRSRWYQKSYVFRLNLHLIACSFFVLTTFWIWWLLDTHELNQTTKDTFAHGTESQKWRVEKEFKKHCGLFIINWIFDIGSWILELGLRMSAWGALQLASCSSCWIVKTESLIVLWLRKTNGKKLTSENVDDAMSG